MYGAENWHVANQGKRTPTIFPHVTESTIRKFKTGQFLDVTHKEKSPGAVYLEVPANEVQLDESGFKSLAVPKSEICASYSESNRTLLLDMSR